MKRCMWAFDVARIYFDRFGLLNLVTLGIFCIVGYGVCVTYFSYSFQWIHFKLCKHTGGIMEICMCLFDADDNNFDGIIAI